MDSIVLVVVVSLSIVALEEGKLISFFEDLMRAADFFDSRSAESRLKELKAWIAQKGVRDFDKVPLYSDQLEKVRRSFSFASAGLTDL